jgi:hypothetical protein
MSDEMEKARDVGDDLSPRDMVGAPEQSAGSDGSILEGNARHEDQIPPDSDGANYLKPDSSKESSGHSYIDKKVDKATGTVTYFYEGNVRSIHHPDAMKNDPAFHKRQAVSHREQAQVSRMLDDNQSKGHLNASYGHDLAASIKESSSRNRRDASRGLRNWAERVGSKDEGTVVPDFDELGRPKGKPEETPRRSPPMRSAGRGPVEKSESSSLLDFTSFLDKEGAIGTVDGIGTVAVSSDPGAFSPTYGERSPIKQKKKKSGVAKLDQFLRGKQESKQFVQKFASTVVNDALQELRVSDIIKADELSSYGDKPYLAVRKETYNGWVEKIDDDKYNEDPRVVDKASPPKSEEEEKPEEMPSEPKPNKPSASFGSDGKGVVAFVSKEEDEEFFSLFKDYFEYLDKEQENTDDSRDDEERPDSNEASGGDLD